MHISAFFKKYKDDVFRVLGAALLCVLVALFIVAFRRDMLPYASDGDAFDTVYALDDAQADGAAY